MNTYEITAWNKSTKEFKTLGQVTALSAHLAVVEIKSLGYGELFTNIFAIKVGA